MANYYEKPDADCHKATQWHLEFITKMATEIAYRIHDNIDSMENYRVNFFELHALGYIAREGYSGVSFNDFIMPLVYPNTCLLSDNSADTPERNLARLANELSGRIETTYFTGRRRDAGASGGDSAGSQRTRGTPSVLQATPLGPITRIAEGAFEGDAQQNK